MLTLNEIKKEWLLQQSFNNEWTSLESFIRSNFCPVYGKNLDFQGWARGAIEAECN